MRVKVLTVICIIAAAAAAVAQNNKIPLNWTDTTRDVFIDNELDRSAQVLNSDSPSRLALISDRFGFAVVLDVPQHTVSTIAKDAFQFGADKTSATSDAGAAIKAIGKFTRLDGPIYFFAVEGKPVLIRAHPGATGELT